MSQTIWHFANLLLFLSIYVNNNIIFFLSFEVVEQMFTSGSFNLLKLIWSTFACGPDTIGMLLVKFMVFRDHWPCISRLIGRYQYVHFNDSLDSTFALLHFCTGINILHITLVFSILTKHVMLIFLQCLSQRVQEWGCSGWNMGARLGYRARWWPEPMLFSKSWSFSYPILFIGNAFASG